MKMWNSSCHFLMILTLTIYTNFTKGIKWITEPIQVNKCKGQTANLTWEYIEEPGEEITQLQWIFNRTELIAYSSLNQGFNVEPKYQGRIIQSGKTGILLQNISTIDIGNYTLYPLIKWEESPNIQTVRLNVIEAAMEPDCSCKKLPVLPEKTSGQTYQIVIGGCNLEINASFCCPVGLAIQYCVNDPSKFCAPMRNLNNVTVSTTQSIIMTQERDPAGNKELNIILLDQKKAINSVLVISSLCFCVMCIMMGILTCVFCINRQIIFRKLKKSTSVLENNQESLSLRVEDAYHERT